MEEERGCRVRFLIDDHEKVPIDTMIMIATSAGIGICATQSPRNTTRISSTVPAGKAPSQPGPLRFSLPDHLTPLGRKVQELSMQGQEKAAIPLVEAALRKAKAEIDRKSLKALLDKLTTRTRKAPAP